MGVWDGWKNVGIWTSRKKSGIWNSWKVLGAYLGVFRLTVKVCYRSKVIGIVRKLSDRLTPDQVSKKYWPHNIFTYFIGKISFSIQKIPNFYLPGTPLCWNKQKLQVCKFGVSSSFSGENFLFWSPETILQLKKTFLQIFLPSNYNKISALQNQSKSARGANFPASHRYINF